MANECQQILCIVSTLKNHATDVEHQIDEALREVRSPTNQWRPTKATATTALFATRPRWNGRCCRARPT